MSSFSRSRGAAAASMPRESPSAPQLPLIAQHTRLRMDGGIRFPYGYLRAVQGRASKGAVGVRRGTNARRAARVWVFEGRCGP